MLRSLTADERRVLLAHERAHLRHRHHLYRAAAAVSAALNPMLAALPRTVEYATERWADERAAEGVGDRRLAARAIIQAALVTTRYRGSPAGVALGFDQADVPSRIGSLLAAPPRRRPFVAAVLVAALATCLYAANDARADTEKLFENAENGEQFVTPSPQNGSAHPSEALPRPAVDGELTGRE
jgi:beta-lactamase regulating signal transducer with metallopeptidase domain